MSVPTQRDPAGPDTGAWRLLEAINRVDDSVRSLAQDMATRFDKLDERFVPRREVDQRFAESVRDRADLRAQLAQARTQHDNDVDHLAQQIAEQQRQRRSDRRYAISTSIAGLGSVVGLLAFVVPHLS